MNGLPVWTCCLHGHHCWSTYGFEAGPPGTHIREAVNYHPPGDGQCSECGERGLEFYRLAHNQALVCRSCYARICQDISDANRARAEEIRKSLQPELNADGLIHEAAGTER